MAPKPMVTGSDVQLQSMAHKPQHRDDASRNPEDTPTARPKYTLSWDKPQGDVYQR